MHNQSTRLGPLSLLLCATLLLPLTAKAKDDHSITYDPCTPSQNAGTTCLLKASEIRPTQANVGVMQVQCKYNKFIEKDGPAMGDYLNAYAHHVPAIIGPDGNFYITDHHHMSTALWLTQEQGKHTSWDLRINILETHFSGQKDDSEKTMATFWQYMEDNNFAYLYNNGTPITWQELPTNLAGLTDDPYRSQAGLQKNEGLYGFIKPATNAMFFLEFKWGNLMRSNRILGDSPTAIPACELNVDDNNLWYQPGQGNTCAQQADLQQEQLRAAYNLLTSSCAAAAMVPECMHSMEGVKQLCGYNPNPDFPENIRITHKCNIKPAE